MMFTTEIEAVEVDGRSFATLEAALNNVSTTLTTGVNNGMVAISKALLDSLKKVGETVASKHSNAWNGQVVNDTPFLQSRTGAGIKSLLESIKLTTNGKTVVAGQITTGGLTVHETGAVVRAKKAKYLTIPLPAAMDGRGVPLRARARDWDNTFVSRSRRGTLLIFQRRGKSIVPLYLLKPSVVIPARLDLEGEVNAGLPYFEQKAFEALADAMEASY